MGSNFAITLLGHGRPLQGDDSCDMPVLTAPAAPRPPGLLSPLLLASGGPPPGSFARDDRGWAPLRGKPRELRRSRYLIFGLRKSAAPSAERTKAQSDLDP